MMMGRPGQANPRGAMGRGPMGHGPTMMAGEKARDFKGTVVKLLRYLSSHRAAMVVVLVFTIGSTVFSIVGPMILGEATTRLFEGVMSQLAGTGSVDFGYIGNVLLVAAGLYMASALFSYIQGWIMSGVSVEVTYRLRQDIAAKINRMPFRYFDGTSQGEVLSRVTNDVDTISQTLNQSLAQVVTSVVTVVVPR